MHNYYRTNRLGVATAKSYLHMWDLGNPIFIYLFTHLFDYSSIYFAIINIFTSRSSGTPFRIILSELYVDKNDQLLKINNTIEKNNNKQLKQIWPQTYLFSYTNLTHISECIKNIFFNHLKRNSWSKNSSSVIFYTPPCQRNVRWSFLVNKTFPELRSKTALRHSPKQLNKLRTTRKKLSTAHLA